MLDTLVRGDNAGCAMLHTHSHMMQCWILLLYLIIKTLTRKSEPVMLDALIGGDNAMLHTHSHMMQCWILLLYLIIKTLT